MKDVGFELLPFQEPLNPRLTVCPGAIVPFQLALVIVTELPDCEKVPFHPCVTVWPLAKVNFRVQPLMVAEPLLVIAMLAVKPPGH